MLCELRLRCRGCGRDYRLSDLPLDASGRFGVAPRCRRCRAARMSSHRSKVRALEMRASPQKTCSRCGTIKDGVGFYRDTGKKDGLSSHCRDCCRAARMSQPKRAVPVRVPEIPATKVCRTCREELGSAAFSVNARSRDGLTAHCRKCVSIWAATSTYGIDFGTAKALRAMLSCECCGKSLGSGEVCIDHCHDTGRVRGAVCGACNTMLGFARSSPDVLRSGALYLERAAAAGHWVPKNLYPKPD